MRIQKNETLGQGKSKMAISARWLTDGFSLVLHPPKAQWNFVAVSSYDEIQNKDPVLEAQQ